MTVFTKIINRELPSTIVYEDSEIIVIKDIKPIANTHLLVIPKKEIECVDDLTTLDSKLISDMFFVIQKVAKDLGIERAYNLHINVGKEGGQEVPHLHIHLVSDKVIKGVS